MLNFLFGRLKIRKVWGGTKEFVGWSRQGVERERGSRGIGAIP